MSEERMSALALMKIHRQRTKDIDLDLAVTMFANRHSRRMLLPFMFTDFWDLYFFVQHAPFAARARSLCIVFPY